ncbi:MAG: hypothetical protein ACR2MX_12920 [Cyclobacteriaceae bacterium]
MLTNMKYRIINYVLLLFFLGSVMTTACNDPYMEQPEAIVQGLPTAQMQKALPNLRPALVFGVKSGQINVSPYKCRPADSMVCLTLVPKLEIPQALVEEFIDIPIWPDPCPWAISCPPFVPVVTQLADLNGNPILMEEWDADPLMVEGDFLFIQFNDPQEEALLSGEAYGLAEPIALDPSWTKYLGIDGNVINEGVYFTQYNKEHNSTTMAVPLKNVGYPKQ